MTCEPFRSTDGQMSGFICGRGSQPKRAMCDVKDCGWQHEKLCDWPVPVPGSSRGETKT